MTLERWLHNQVGPAYDALKADPSRAVSADQVRHTLTELDQAERLTSAEAVAAFLDAAEATADPAYIEHARDVAARARVMHGLDG